MRGGGGGGRPGPSDRKKLSQGFSSPQRISQKGVQWFYIVFQGDREVHHLPGCPRLSSEGGIGNGIFPI